MADLDTIDGQLDELRAVPDNLDELIARYGEQDRTLERIDDVLVALAAGSRPASVPPLGATPSQPPYAMRGSQPAAGPSQPAPAAGLTDALFGDAPAADAGPTPTVDEPPLELEDDGAPEPDLELEDDAPRFSPFDQPEASMAQVAPPASQPSASVVPPLRSDRAPASHAPGVSGESDATVVRSSADFQELLAQAAASHAEPRFGDTLPEGAVAPVTADAAQDEDAMSADGLESDDALEMLVDDDDILEIDGDDFEMLNDE